MTTTNATPFVLKPTFATPDGTVFDTKAEAMEYMRKPQIIGALNEITNNNDKLVDWLYKNMETVEVAFEVGSIRRVTKVEMAKFEKGLEALKAIEGNPALTFLQQHTEAVRFQWPAVKRLTDAEKATAARNTLTAASEGNVELAEWVVANQEAVLKAFKAGIEVRQVSPKATEALAAYQAKKAAEKAAYLATPEGQAAAKAAAEKEAARAAKKAAEAAAAAAAG